MNRTKCLIVDDEPLAIELILDHVSKFPDFEVVYTTHNPLEAIQTIKDGEIDLVFLDIQMPVLTGIELVRALRNPPAIIFTTAYRDYAVESYELEVVDYLVKPIKFTRFLQAIHKYLEIKNYKQADEKLVKDTLEKQKDHLFVNSNKKFLKVLFKDILYLESLKEYIGIHTDEGRVVTKATMDAIEKELPGVFIRVHRSFIVNTNKITAFTAHDIEIGKKEIPIGGSYKNAVRDRLIG